MGQITLNTALGRYIYKKCSVDHSIRTVVDIGTWDGRGTTECAILGLKASGRAEIDFLSFETNKQFYDSAVSYWKSQDIPSWAKLIHGRLVDETELDKENLAGDEPNWLNQDISWYSKTPLVSNLLPPKIDLAILDGGEFSTKAEFLLLEPRTRIFVLDDTLTRKCKWIRQHVLSNTTKYEVIFDNANERNGTMAFVKLNEAKRTLK